MDIQKILDRKIKELPPGSHVDGLRAVKSHIDSAIRHLTRGQEEPDETLFTDVIFRCNQAFEGSIKEAYRVIAGKDPQNVKPYEIEQFLGSSNILRKKVLDQFTIYRREWRNPSAHDYTLDFDEDEALLAIVSVVAFAIVLCDQINGKLAFNDAAAATPSSKFTNEEKKLPLLDLVTKAAFSFATSYVDVTGPTKSHAHDYYRLEGALAGYLTSKFAINPDIKVEQNKKFSSSAADIIVQRDHEKIVIELKRTSNKSTIKSILNSAVTQAALYLHEDNVVGAVALLFAIHGGSYIITPGSGALSKAVRIISPSTEK